MKNLLLSLSAIFVLAACSDSNPTQIVDVDVSGTYDLTTLNFDPQGVLPQVDLKSRITSTIPRLILASNNQAQLVFTDPSTGLLTVSNATYTLNNAATQISLDFGTTNTTYTQTFLSRKMTFSYSQTNHALTFAAASPDGVTRARLVQLVPEWQNEQLLDPVPGTLTVVFQLSTTSGT